MSARSVLIAAATAAAIFAAWFWQSSDSTSQTTESEHSKASPTTTTEALDAKHAADANTSTRSNPEAERNQLRWAKVDGGMRVVPDEDARGQWAENRTRIYNTLRDRNDFHDAGLLDAGSLAAPTLKREYIQSAVNELKPLFAECYELARSEDPGLEGKLVVSFTIAADDSGGIVERAEIADGATADHTTLRECMRETIYTLSLPKPEGGGVIHVNYPFQFAQRRAMPDGGTPTSQ